MERTEELTLVLVDVDPLPLPEPVPEAPELSDPVAVALVFDVVDAAKKRSEDW